MRAWVLGLLAAFLVGALGAASPERAGPTACPCDHPDEIEDARAGDAPCDDPCPEDCPGCACCSGVAPAIVVAVAPTLPFAAAVASPTPPLHASTAGVTPDVFRPPRGHG